MLLHSIDSAARNLTLVLLALPCALAGSACRSGEGQMSPGPKPVPVAGGPSRVDPLARIAELEAARTDGDGQLQQLTREGDEGVRARAVVALGRLPFPEFGESVDQALETALSDPGARVRAAAAFALGLRANPRSARALRGAWDDPEPLVRARVVQAAGRLPTAELRPEILHRLFTDQSFRVRVEAALATHRWAPSEEGATETDIALARLALAGFEAGDADAGPLARRPEAPEVVWRALFSLQHRAWARANAGERAATPEKAREALLHWARPEARGEARLFAVKGLGALPADERVREALYAGLQSEDWRVACEAARGLGEMPHPESLGPLERALAHPSTHVRQTAAFALGGFAELRTEVGPLLALARGDASANVRAAAVESLARLDGDACGAELAERAVEIDARLRAAVARATQHLGAEAAVPILLRLTRDPDPGVAYQATQSLGRHPVPASRERLRELIRGSDVGLRLAAIRGLGEAPTAEDLPLLETAWATTTGELAGSTRSACLEVAAKVGGPEAIALLRRGAVTGGMHERRVARTALARLQPGEPPVEEAPLLRLGTPKPGRALPERPVVEVLTSRGTLVFELFPDEAPRHVRNFLELAERDEYKGLKFHRVVADFVVQGGDHRGDGLGGRTFDGEPLLPEFGPREFGRGALGMPRNDDPESGGSQFFVTHRPTPHLDGRYTLFGELRQGFEVLDSLEVGDRILEVRLRGARP